MKKTLSRKDFAISSLKGPALSKRSVSKGFTLIELLVVIAIIGILAGIILTSLSTARNKASDAKIESQLGSMRTTAEMYATDHESLYSGETCALGMFLEDGMKKLTDGILGIKCGVGVDLKTWAAGAPLVSDATKFWCVDSTGASRLVTDGGTASIVDGFDVCP